MFDRFLQRLQLWHVLAIVMLASIIVYWPGIYHGFIDVDDPGFIVANPLLQNVSFASFFKAFGSVTMLLYLPVTVVSYQVNVLIAGFDPSIFHLTDIVLHGCNAALVAAIIMRLTKSPLAALLCSLLFVAHPIHTEAVLWASSRKDVLSTTFALLSILSYLKGKRTSILWYLLALLSKIAVFPLPLLFVLLDIRDGREGWKRLLLEKTPYALIAVPLLIVGVFAGNQFALGVDPWTLLLLGAKSTAFLTLQLAWPSHLLFFHLERSAITLTNPVFAISLLFLIGVIVTAVILRRKRVHLPAFGITFFLVMLFPTFLAAQKAGILFFTSDKYAYLPSIGLLIAIAAGIRAIEAHWKALLLPLTILLVFCAAMLTVLTRELMPSWTSAESLERAVLAKDESNYIARSNLGLLIQKETPDDALAQFMAAIESEPHYAIPYFNAASVLRSQGKQDEAVALFATMIPQLTEREVRGDRSLQTALVWLAQKFGEWGKPDLSEQLIEKLQQMVPHLFELR